MAETTDNLQDFTWIYMKKCLAAAALFACVLASATAAEPAPLKRSYAAKFDRAVNLIDEYHGDGEALVAVRKELEEVLRVYPRYAPAYREMARYFMLEGHLHSLRFKPGALEAADAALQKAISIRPHYAEAFVLYGHLYKLMGRHQDALAALAKAEKLGTTDPWLENNWADLLNDEEKYEDAAVRYRRVLASGTRNTKAMSAALVGMTTYYLNIGNLDEADAMYRKRIAFRPHMAWTHGDYAQFLLCWKADFEGAIIHGRQALDIMDYGAGRYWLAAALYRKWAQAPEDIETGGSAFAQAQDLYPDLTSIVRNAESCPTLAVVAAALERARPAADTTSMPE
ncbi:hypothetical protein G4G28_16625 [Massilia sp. Dwa41.01b]|uniref:tetratricopeptide repeat protein n=1 Tax=unclassified Massilia TaxID=2609279 RepID=UPI0015FF1E49|nr:MULTISPECIES: hypothetical protein [unclassified Massilia]QNA89690.1 hypothetical protein G4G28_16625 [Massilia sp. Dwa41.01b]QNB00585.1 hypothetical protein G4G31_20210 [Massilia sp. Se16.2.3]